MITGRFVEEPEAGAPLFSLPDDGSFKDLSRSPPSGSLTLSAYDYL